MGYMTLGYLSRYWTIKIKDKSYKINSQLNSFKRAYMVCNYRKDRLSFKRLRILHSRKTPLTVKGQSDYIIRFFAKSLSICKEDYSIHSIQALSVYKMRKET